MKINELNEFTKYDKIISPFVKDEKFKNTTEFKEQLPLGNWIVTEKIDGTNIRIILTQQDNDGNREVIVGSRQLILNKEDKTSTVFFDCLKDINFNKLIDYFKNIKQTVIIYGEGYGAGIQKGGIYSKVKNYRVFDIRIGKTYQDFNYVLKVCLDNQLNTVPLLTEFCEIDYNFCISLLKRYEKTFITEGDGGNSEGLVIKFDPVLLNKYGDRLIFKVKFKDFNEFVNKK